MISVDNSEAVPIARLLGDGGTTIGWVYQWESFELSIMWITDERHAVDVEPCLSSEASKKVTPFTDHHVTELLQELSNSVRHEPVWK